MKYKVSIHLDKILKEKGYSQTRLIADSGLSHKFIVQLLNHENAAAFDKLMAILNTLNEHGYHVKPSDLVSFDPIGKARLQIIYAQPNLPDPSHSKDHPSLTLFIHISYDNKSYYDLVDLVINEKDNTLQIQLKGIENSISPSLMATVASKAPLHMSDGLCLLEQIPIAELEHLARTFTTIAVAQARSQELIANKPNYTINFQWIDRYNMELGTLLAADNSVQFQKGAKFSYKATCKDPENRLYPFLHSHQVGIVSSEADLKPQPHHTPDPDYINQLFEIWKANQSSKQD